jgi:taurine dioxygenase
MTHSAVKIQALTPTLGAVLTGVDLAQTLHDDDFAVMRQAFARYGVIFFRDQHLSPEQHIAFAKRWAPIEINPFFKAVPGYPEIAEVRKDADQTTNIGGDWHTDHSYNTAPSMGSMLLARQLPPHGGDTLFADMGLAYEALSDGLKKTLNGLRAVHSASHVFGGQGGYAKLGDIGQRVGTSAPLSADVVHPVVIAHPDTGRKTLYVNAAFTVRFEGWTEQESAGLLHYLYQHAGSPQFCCRFEWQPGSMAFWDNRATWHRALNDYPGHLRLMHRITVQGQALASAPAAG